MTGVGFTLSQMEGRNKSELCPTRVRQWSPTLQAFASQVRSAGVQGKCCLLAKSEHLVGWLTVHLIVNVVRWEVYEFSQVFSSSATSLLVTKK